MTPEAVIQTYVSEVMRLLPRRIRDDIGFELADQLRLELGDRAEELSRAPEISDALAILDRHGAPEALAERYLGAGLTIVPPLRAMRFLVISIVGIAVQWALTLPPAFSRGALGQWWLGAGLTAFWWPGFLVLCMAAGALLAQSSRQTASRWKPKWLDPDQINRRGMVGALVAAALGVLVLSTLPAWSSNSTLAGAKAFALDPMFQAARGPWALLLWAGNLALIASLIANGRWTAKLRTLRSVIDFSWLALLGWWIAAGPIFLAPPTDGTVKLLLVLIMIGIVAANIVRFMRRDRIPVAPIATR